MRSAYITIGLWVAYMMLKNLDNGIFTYFAFIIEPTTTLTIEGPFLYTVLRTRCCVLPGHAHECTICINLSYMQSNAPCSSTVSVVPTDVTSCSYNSLRVLSTSSLKSSELLSLSFTLLTSIAVPFFPHDKIVFERLARHSGFAVFNTLTYGAYYWEVVG